MGTIVSPLNLAAEWFAGVDTIPAHTTYLCVCPGTLTWALTTIHGIWTSPSPITPSVNSMSFPQPARHSLVGTELQIQDSLLALWTLAGDLVPLRLSFPQKERGRVLQIWPRGLPFPTISPTPRPRPQSYPFPGQESNAGGHFVADTNCPLTP